MATTDTGVLGACTQSQLRGQCRRKYSQLFSIWMHLKVCVDWVRTNLGPGADESSRVLQAIRVFVESVLRYGLPVNFVCALLQPVKDSDSKLHSALSKEFADNSFDDFMGGGDLGDFGAAAAMGGGFGADEDFYPYIFLPFSPIGR